MIGANQHTALYTPATNTWAAGPDMMGTSGGVSFPLGRMMHPLPLCRTVTCCLPLIFGPGVNTTGNTTSGSAIIGDSQYGRLSNRLGSQRDRDSQQHHILSVDSPSQIHINRNATATNTGVTLKIGTTFDKPTQLFDLTSDVYNQSGVARDSGCQPE